MVVRAGEGREGNRGGARGKRYHTQEDQMRAWNGRAFAAAAVIVGAICLASLVHFPGETNHPGLVASARAQPEPIRRLIDWLRGLTMPAGIVKAEGRVEAIQVDVSSKYAGEVVDVAVQEGDRVAAGEVIARLSSPQLDAQLRNAESDLTSAKEARAQDAIKAAEAKVEQIKSMIGELTLVSPRLGKVQFQLAHAGDSVGAGAPIVTLIDLTDVYMTVFVRAADASKLAMGDEARLILDKAPDYVVPAAVSFVAKAVGTKDDLAKLMLRVDLRIDPKVVETYYGKVEAGLRGAGFVRTRPDAKWPAELQVKLPPAPVAPEPKPAPAPPAPEAAPASASTGGASAPSAPAAVPMSAAKSPTSEPGAQAPAPASAPASAPVAEAAAPVPRLPAPTPVPPLATPAPSPQPTSAPAPAPLAEASRSSPVAREAKPAPPPPPAPAHAPAAQASMSAGLGPELAAEVAPESLAQLAGAWAPSAADCNKLFQRRGSAVAYRQPVDKFAQAAIIESQRIRLPTGVCRLERASHEGGALKVSGECQDSISYTPQTAYVKLRSKNEIVFSPNSDSALDTSMTRCPL